MNRPRNTHLSSGRRLAPVLLAIVTLCGLWAAPAGAASEIEGVWSFNGGEVAVKPAAGGRFVGIVTSPTKFAECIHQAGEYMWTEMTLQTDGSYWGHHVWFFEKSCQPNPVPGPTAWRVMHNAEGERYLKVCFSEPGKSQPTIAPNGATTNVSDKCVESSPTAPLPVVSHSPASQGITKAEEISFANTILLPKANQCVRKGTLRIKIKEPKRDPLKQVLVQIKKRTIANVRSIKRIEHGIVLRHLPTGTYTLKVLAVTVLNQRLSGHRTYYSCGAHPRRITVHRRHKRH